MSGSIIIAGAVVASVFIACVTIVTYVVLTHCHRERMREADYEQERALAGIAATVARTAAPVMGRTYPPRPRAN